MIHYLFTANDVNALSRIFQPSAVEVKEHKSHFGTKKVTIR